MSVLEKEIVKFEGSTAVVRVDFNVPVKDGIIQDTTRILAVKPTIEVLKNCGCKVVLISHFKDPKEEVLSDPIKKAEYSFVRISSQISKNLGREVNVYDLSQVNVKEKIDSLNNSELILLENVRFLPGEKKGDLELAKKLASLGDFYVNEAFSCSHRRHASVTEIAKFLPTFPGIHFEQEIRALKHAFYGEEVGKPILAVIGGAKISTKFPVLKNLLPKVDFLAIGGAMVHTFLVSQGFSVGKSLYEPDYVGQAGELLDSYREKLLFPNDVLVGASLTSTPSIVEVSNGLPGIPDDMAAYDIGPDTVRSWAPVICQAKTIVWNGTLGVAEQKPFDEGTKQVLREICKNKDAFSLAGGGDTITALNEMGQIDSLSHICTGGGAFLDWLADGRLPAEETFSVVF